jgi:hypothetical protein
MNIRSLLAFTLWLLIASAGCDRQGAAWEEARAADNVAAYQEFLEAYPDSPQANEAQQRILGLRRELAWEAARQADSIEAYQQFLEQFPDGEAVQQARNRLDELEGQEAWRALQQSTDLAALRAFADEYRGSAVGTQAEQRIAELEAAAARDRERAEEERRRREAEEAALSHRVQLAALRTQQQAHDGASRLQERLADVLGETRIEVQQSGNFHLLRTQPLSEQDALALCDRLKARGSDCLVVAR